MSDDLTPEEEALIRQAARLHAAAMASIAGDLENVNFTGLLAQLERDLPDPVPATPPKSALEILQDAAKAIPSPAPKTTAARVELGSLALHTFREGVPSTTGWTSPLTSLWGAPIVENLGLPPFAWRMVSLDGTVIHEGAINPAGTP